MKRLNPTPRRRVRGFSITELLVSISIVGLLLAIVFPVISVMTNSSRVEAGQNVVGMASDVARQWVQAEAWANDASTNAGSAVNEQYSGTAALYCPTGEIRIVVNDRNANNGSAFLEDLPAELNGYKDLSNIDFIQIPDGAGVAGIQRTGSGATAIRFIAPPFAIAFNEAGQLNYGDTNGYIYYDADGRNGYDTTTDGRRYAGYDPFDWRGYDSATNANLMTGSLKKELPFEAIECVPGVVIFSTKEFEDAGFDFDGNSGAIDPTNEAAAWAWLNENGKTIFFSPHTGVALTEEEQD